MENEFSLDDARRVKTLSPGVLTAKRFFRNRLAVVGLVILSAMFLFSFLGGLLIPYGQEQVFYREDIQKKEFAAVSRNDQYRITATEAMDAVLQAQISLAISRGENSLSYEDITYAIVSEGEDFYGIFTGENPVAFANKDIIHGGGSFPFSYEALKAYSSGQAVFNAEGKSYRIDENGNIFGSNGEAGFISRLIIRPRVAGTDISRDFRAAAQQAILENAEEFTYREESGESRSFTLSYELTNKLWSAKEETLTRVWDAYAAPSKTHLLGTDKNGMDMLTRLMYGGRVSLVIGFIVVFISALIGVVLGGFAGYFGKWVDNLIMRLVDIFYCVPSTPLLIILGAAMDGMRVDPQIRMLLLMLILGFLGWPGIARLVRGQILSLREQEFMTATESSGLSVYRRIFKHLIPNVIPQLIVSCTMSLGSTILTEATLSFLGLGVKFPFASWGNIMNDVSNAHVLTSYWFVWIPAGVCLVLSVLGFNFVGDGLRDAFDPKMKR